MPLTLFIPKFDTLTDLLFLIKLMRIKTGLILFDSSQWYQLINDLIRKKVQNQIKKDDRFGEDIYNDNNNFEFLLLVKYMLNTLYLIILIFNVSFLIGMAFLKMAIIFEHIYHANGIDREDTFEKYFFGSFDDHSHLRMTITLTYYSFTSLSTVGFGDLHPRADTERLLCAFILLSGVTIFSLIMGTFIEFLNEFKNFHMEKEEEEADALTMFLQCLNKLNGNMPINENFKIRIEQFFDFRWKNDRNSSLDDPEELEVFYQLPFECRDQIYFKFLFQDFLKKFKLFFCVEKNISFKMNYVEKQFLTWQERTFSEFTVNLLTKLEPRFEAKKTIIFDELDDVQEIIFVMKGSVVVGYEINRVKKFSLVLKDRAIIGAHDTTFNKKSQFVYSTLSRIEGFFIRKENWLEILRENPDISP